MKTEAEIRTFRDNLRRTLKYDCQCRGLVHDHECLLGRSIAIGTEAALSWLLEEDGHYDHMVEQIAMSAARSI